MPFGFEATEILKLVLSGPELLKLVRSGPVSDILKLARSGNVEVGPARKSRKKLARPGPKYVFESRPGPARPGPAPGHPPGPEL